MLLFKGRLSSDARGGAWEGVGRREHEVGTWMGGPKIYNCSQNSQMILAKIALSMLHFD